MRRPTRLSCSEVNMTAEGAKATVLAPSHDLIKSPLMKAGLMKKSLGLSLLTIALYHC